MSIETVIFLIGLSGKINQTIQPLVFITGMTTGLLFIVYAGQTWAQEAGDQYWTNLIQSSRSLLRGSAAVFALFLTLYVAVPTQQTMVLIAASKVGQEVVKSEAVDSITKKVIAPSIDLLNEYITKELANIRKENEK